MATSVPTVRPAEPIEIFKVGTHTPMRGVALSFSRGTLLETAAAYDPARHEAPIVIGHPHIDAPAYGWVRGLHVKGDSLFADVQDVDPAFAALVRERRYSKISAAFWSPDNADSPSPGVYALRHVGFLGATAPAVKGMRQARFTADDAGVVTFAGFDADPALEALRKENEDLRKRLRTDDGAAFAARMEKEGRILPCFKDGLIAFMGQLDDDGVVSFSVGGAEKRMPSRDWLKSFIQGQPPVVPYGLVDMGAPPGDYAVTDGFTVPNGFAVSTSGAEMHERIQAHAKTHNVSFAEAAHAVAAAARRG